MLHIKTGLMMIKCKKILFLKKVQFIQFFALLFGLIALVAGSNYAVVYAEKIAVLLKISELVIGLTIIAIGTSLPELAATISAIIKKKTDMVSSENVIGSNVLNITLVVPIIRIFLKCSA